LQCCEPVVGGGAVGRSYFWDLEEHGLNSYPEKGRREE